MDLPNTDIEIFDTFHCFPQLPAEIRLKIWAFTFPGPRVAEVSWSASSESWNSVPESHNVACSSSLVNHEARHEFLLSWRPLFLRDPASDAIAVEYFNPAIDTLYIGAGWTEGFEENSSFTENACRALSELWCTPQLRSLACEIREWENGTPRVGRDGRRIPRSPEWESDILSLFPALESFVIADYDYDWICIEEGMKRGRGPVELVEPTQMDPDKFVSFPYYICNPLSGSPTSFFILSSILMY